MKRHLKVLARFLALLILIQSCTVYKSANVSLSEAAKSNLNVKITTDSGKIVRFKRVEFSDDGKFYGFVNNTRKFWINTGQVQKVQLKNNKKETMILIGVSAVVVTVIGLLLVNNPPTIDIYGD
ncbi:hypothetical protein [Aestuariivivens sediminicola]|uniref:hypothetical protein n=1 Tax=Aestuariivivens sediminicola TaxID=2913560 RepID=UPI001F5A7A45|nr:hypothetical protein [Aestuariivivens sediminicola]